MLKYAQQPSKRLFQPFLDAANVSGKGVRKGQNLCSNNFHCSPKYNLSINL